jgi:hypothetical protein
MAVSSAMRVATPSHVLARRLEDELVLLNLDSECYFGLDEVGARMWDVLSSSPSIEAGIERLLEEYDVEPDRLRADVEAFVGGLVDNGLVELQQA